MHCFTLDVLARLCAPNCCFLLQCITCVRSSHVTSTMCVFCVCLSHHTFSCISHISLMSLTVRSSHIISSRSILFFQAALSPFLRSDALRSIVAPRSSPLDCGRPPFGSSWPPAWQTRWCAYPPMKLAVYTRHCKHESHLTKARALYIFGAASELSCRIMVLRFPINPMIVLDFRVASSDLWTRKPSETHQSVYDCLCQRPEFFHVSCSVMVDALDYESTPALQISARPFRMLLEIRLPAHFVHCKCCSTNVRLRGVTAINQIAIFSNATKQTEKRNTTEHAREQRKTRLHISLVWIWTCCHSAVPRLAAPAMSLSDDAKSACLQLSLLSLRVSAANVVMPGHPESNQGQSDCCRRRQPDASPTEL